MAIKIFPDVKSERKRLIEITFQIINRPVWFVPFRTPLLVNVF